jgi:sporulation protein YlmC with PRC-barrel domain
MDDIGTEHLDRDETSSLISAQKVRGTAVYDASGDRIGTVDDIMLTKQGGDVAYAVMSFGGFLGIGEKYHPLPWDVLDYDTGLGGYRVSAVGENFRDAPSDSRDALDRDDWWTPTERYYEDAASSGRIGRRSERDPTRATLPDRSPTDF